MKLHRGALIAGAVGLVLASGTFAPSGAEEATPPPIAAELLTPRSSFTDDVRLQVQLKLDGRSADVVNVKDPSKTVVARITVQPGAQFPWHTHRGPVLVNVAAGSLTYVNADDCVERDYASGSAFVDPGRGNVHTAFNASNEVTVLYATFLEAPASGSPTITAGVTEPADCDVQVGTHAH
jgi:quercetin dioxygenase-like cupin family protein